MGGGPDELTNWRKWLTTREINEVAMAQIYVNDFSHGTTGHNRIVLIAKLAALLDAHEGIENDTVAFIQPPDLDPAVGDPPAVSLEDLDTSQ